MAASSGVFAPLLPPRRPTTDLGITVERRNDGLYFSDMRFGRSDSWLDTTRSYIFVFRLLQNPDDPSRVLDFRQQGPYFARDAKTLDRLWRRIQGDKRVEVH